MNIKTDLELAAKVEELLGDLQRAAENDVVGLCNQIEGLLCNKHRGTYGGHLLLCAAALAAAERSMLRESGPSVALTALMNNLYYFDPEDGDPKLKAEVRAHFVEYSDESLASQRG